MLVSKAKERFRRREGVDPNKEDLILLVPELCYMTGLSDEQRSNFRLMKVMAW